MSEKVGRVLPWADEPRSLLLMAVPHPIPVPAELPKDGGDPGGDQGGN